MKICVLGNGMLAEDFKRMNFVVLNDDIYSFDTKILDDYDTKLGRASCRERV